MTWTVACFCGATYSAPPLECLRCAAAVPDTGHSTLARAAGRPGAAHDLASIANLRRGLR